MSQPEPFAIHSRQRTVNYVRQVGASIFFKAGAVAGSLVAIPLMIHYLGQERFGVWSTLLGVVSWAVLFDLGIGNGLRNKVAESLAKNERGEAAGYISSGYTVIGLLVLVLWPAIWIASVYVPWQTFFNTKSVPEDMLRHAVQIVASFMLLNFWLGLIGSLLGAVQKNSLIPAGQLISSVCSVVLVYVLSVTTEASLVNLAWAFGVSLFIGNAILTWRYFTTYPDLTPSIRLRRKHLRPILTVGLQFFVMQIAGLIIFTTDKMLISHFFGPQYVTRYEVVFKMFSLLNVLHNLISAPLWSAYTDAWHRSDLAWMRRMLHKQLGVFLLFCAGAVLLAVVSQPLAALWVGPEVPIDQSVVIAMTLMTIVSIWNNVFVVPLSGMSKVRLGSIYTVLTAALNIPLAWYLSVHLGLGVAGVVIATTLSIVFASIISPIQIYYFVWSTRKSTVLDRLLR